MRITASSSDIAAPSGPVPSPPRPACSLTNGVAGVGDHGRPDHSACAVLGVVG